MSGWDSNNRVRRLEEAQKKESLAAQYQIVTVHFPTANADVVVRHNLQPPDPEYVDFEVLNASGPPMVYVDKSPTRVAWGTGYVVLRSAVEGLKCEIRLSVSNIRPGERAPYEAGPHAIFELSATRPQLQLRHAGATARGRVQAHTSDAVYLGYNVSYDGSGWNLDDTTLDAAIAQVHRTVPFSVWRATSGANPRTMTQLIGITTAGIVDLLGGGIQFPATQVASTNANTLDDYEENTWTPTVAFQTGSSGITYGSQLGSYIKIGQFVFFQGRVTLTSKGSSTGQAYVNGLPFTSGNTYYGGMNIHWCSSMNGLASGWWGFINPGGTQVTLVAPVAGGITGVTDTSFTNTSDFLFNGWYRANQ